ncbi:MAG TPA: hypothetical protein VIG51_11920 [Candidatus Baltobacteraceae bacterium]|jgi:plastocyanin
MIRTIPVALLAVVLSAATASAATLSGHGTADVVWVAGAPAPAPVALQMHNQDKSFMPALVVIPEGSSVQFPNDDPFYHSIYSSDGPDHFDIGYYKDGPGKVVPFPKAGVVHVRCHIHAFMQGTIVVAGGPYTMLMNDEFSMALPAGQYTLHAVYSDGSERTLEVKLGAADRSVTLP